jgi:hypothetical protein
MVVERGVSEKTVVIVGKLLKGVKGEKTRSSLPSRSESLGDQVVAQETGRREAGSGKRATAGALHVGRRRTASCSLVSDSKNRSQ